MSDKMVFENDQNPSARYENHEPGSYKDVVLETPVDVRLGLAQRPKAPDPTPFVIKSTATGGR